MTHNRPVTILCLASYHKGHDFPRAAHGLGCRVLLVTSESLRDADWPRPCIDETFYIDTTTTRASRAAAGAGKKGGLPSPATTPWVEAAAD